MTYYADYFFDKGRTIVIDDADNELDLCEEISVVAVLSDVIDHLHRVRIRIVLPKGRAITVNVDRQKIFDDPVSTLSRYGLSVSKVPAYSVTITEILMDTERNAKRLDTHRRLGFRFLKGRTAFYGYKALGAKTPSTYFLPKALRPVGTFEEWRSGIEPFVASRPELQLALAMGACSPVAALLQKASYLDIIPIFALIGQSSSGKSSSLKLMASIYGKPSIADGIIDTLVDTQARFFANLGQKRGFACLFDETSLVNWDFSSVLYQLSLGRERGRLNPDGTLKPVNTWSGCIVFTGETSLFDQTNKNSGLFARLVEFSCSWTKNGEEADEMARFISSHYGTAYIPLVEFLIGHQDEIPALFEDARTTLKDYIDVYSGVEERLVKNYALILATARIIKSVWDISINEEAILFLLLQVHQENIIFHFAEHVYHALQEQILDNWIHFPSHQSVRDATGEWGAGMWGERDTHGNSPCVWIGDNRFSDFLKKAGVNDQSAILKELHAKGWLVKFGDRYKKNHRLGNCELKCYCLLLPKKVTVTSNVAKKTTSSSQLKNLLE